MNRIALFIAATSAIKLVPGTGTSARIGLAPFMTAQGLSAGRRLRDHHVPLLSRA